MLPSLDVMDVQQRAKVHPSMAVKRVQRSPQASALLAAGTPGPSGDTARSGEVLSVELDYSKTWAENGLTRRPRSDVNLDTLMVRVVAQQGLHVLPAVETSKNGAVGHLDCRLQGFRLTFTKHVALDVRRLDLATVKSDLTGGIDERLGEVQSGSVSL